MTCLRCGKTMDATSRTVLSRFVTDRVEVHEDCATEAERAAQRQHFEREYSPDDLAVWARDARP